MTILFDPNLTHFDSAARWWVHQAAMDIAPEQPVRPGLTDTIFDHFKVCTHCYENCSILSRVERRGVVREVCPEAGWGDIGAAPGDVSDMHTVIKLLDEMV